MIKTLIEFSNAILFVCISRSLCLWQFGYSYNQMIATLVAYSRYSYKWILVACILHLHSHCVETIIHIIENGNAKLNCLANKRVCLFNFVSRQNECIILCTHFVAGDEIKWIPQHCVLFVYLQAAKYYIVYREYHSSFTTYMITIPQSTQTQNSVWESNVDKKIVQHCHINQYILTVFNDIANLYKYSHNNYARNIFFFFFPKINKTIFSNK